jgi:hypothetical protein
MRRILLFILLLASVGVRAQQQKEIAYIESTKSWHYVYDSQGRRIVGYSRSSVGDVVGWSSTIFVGKNNGFYRIYDVQGQMLKALSINSVGEVLSVSGDTFTSRLGNWIYIWDKNGKKIGSKSN